MKMRLFPWANLLSLCGVLVLADGVSAQTPSPTITPTNQVFFVGDVVGLGVNNLPDYNDPSVTKPSGTCCEGKTSVPWSPDGNVITRDYITNIWSGQISNGVNQVFLDTASSGEKTVSVQANYKWVCTPENNKKTQTSGPSVPDAQNIVMKVDHLEIYTNNTVQITAALTNFVSWASNGNVVAKAIVDPPNTPTNRFPSAWSFVGGSYSNIVTRYTPQSTTGFTTFIATAGKSAATNTVCVVKVEIDKCPRSFLPKGGSEDNTVQITARVAPLGLKGSFRFTLFSVSSEPGYCMNAPQQVPATGPDSASWKDLQFLPQDGFTISGTDNEIAETTTKDLNTVSVKVKAFDYGAWGRIKVEFMPDGQGTPILGQEKNGSQPFTRIPLDDDINHIADGWQYNKGLAKDDDDSSPQGDGTNGDGLTRYEEYRGFLIRGPEHIRTNPKRKDLFVYSQGLDYEYLGRTGLQLHDVFRTCFSATGGHNSYGGANDTVVNFNHSSHHLVEQHGLWMTIASLVGMYGFADGGPDIRSPRDTYRVEVDVDKIGTDWPSATSRVCRFIIGHEGGHGVGMWHHGDSPVPLPHNKKMDPKVGNLEGTRNHPPGFWADPFDGDSCIMRYLFPPHTNVPSNYTNGDVGVPQAPGDAFPGSRTGLGLKRGHCSKQLHINDN